MTHRAIVARVKRELVFCMGLLEGMRRDECARGQLEAMRHIATVFENCGSPIRAPRKTNGAPGHGKSQARRRRPSVQRTGKGFPTTGK